MAPSSSKLSTLFTFAFSKISQKEDRLANSWAPRDDLNLNWMNWTFIANPDSSPSFSPKNRFPFFSTVVFLELFVPRNKTPLCHKRRHFLGAKNRRTLTNAGEKSKLLMMTGAIKIWMKAGKHDNLTPACTPFCNATCSLRAFVAFPSKVGQMFRNDLIICF